MPWSKAACVELPRARAAAHALPVPVDDRRLGASAAAAGRTLRIGLVRRRARQTRPAPLWAEGRAALVVAGALAGAARLAQSGRRRQREARSWRSAIAATGYVRRARVARACRRRAASMPGANAMSARIAARVRTTVFALRAGAGAGRHPRARRQRLGSTLRATGLTHLIAISGFHVGMVAGFFALLARGLWWLRPALARRLPAPIAAAAGGGAGAAAYTALAGFALPTVRTLLMIAVVAGVRVFAPAIAAPEALALALSRCCWWIRCRCWAPVSG